MYKKRPHIFVQGSVFGCILIKRHKENSQIGVPLGDRGVIVLMQVKERSLMRVMNDLMGVDARG